MPWKSNSRDRKRGHLLSAREELDSIIEFSPYRRPEIYGNPILPAGMAGYEAPASTRKRERMFPGMNIAPQGSRARKGGIIHESTQALKPGLSALSGYKSEADFKKALRRHEIIHSIQSSKRDYKTHSRIRDLLKDEAGAYGEMNRGIKGGSKILRGLNTAIGASASLGIGIAANSRLRRRAGKYALIGAGTVSTGGLLTKVIGKKKETQMSAREQLNEVVNFGVGRVIIKRSSATARGDLEALKASNTARLMPVIPNLSHRIGDEASAEVVGKMRERIGGIQKKPAWNKFIVPLAARAELQSIIKLGSGSNAGENSTHVLAARDELNAIVELKAVDLGYTYDYPTSDAQPLAGSTWAQAGANKKKKHYPSLYVSDTPNDIDLPASGGAKVRYKLRSKTIRQDEEGKKRYSAEIEIQSIDPISAEDDAAPPKEGRKAKLRLSARDQLSEIVSFDIEINPKNEGKFTATLERTGKTAQELKKSKNPLTRKRATFAINARKWAKKRTDQGGQKTEGSMSARDQLGDIIELGEADEVGKATNDAIKKILRRYRPRGAGVVVPRQRGKEYFPRLIGKRTGPAKGWYPERSQDASSLSARDQLNEIRLGRGEILKRTLPNFPLPIGSIFKKKGFVQKEASDALRKLRKGIQGSPFLTEGLSAREELNSIVELADPRPRNNLGMFTDNQDEGPDPNKIDVVYKREIPKTVGQNLAGGAVAGVGAAASGSAVKALFNKLKKVKTP